MVLRASISDVFVVPLQAIINKGICNGHTQRGAQRLNAERRTRDGVSLGEVRVVDELCAWLQWAKAATVHLDQAEENCRTAVTRHDARGRKKKSRAVCVQWFGKPWAVLPTAPAGLTEGWRAWPVSLIGPRRESPFAQRENIGRPEGGLGHPQ